MLLPTLWTTLLTTMATLTATDARAEKIEMKRGTMELGGRATANIVLQDGVSDIFLDLSPSFGYFVARDVELFAGISMFVDEGDVGVGFFGGVDYLIPAHSVRPYIGGSVGYGNTLFGIGNAAFVPGDVVTLSGRAGLLLPLNKHVAVDLGARVNLNVADGTTIVHIPLGYLGIRAFF